MVTKADLLPPYVEAYTEDAIITQGTTITYIVQGWFGAVDGKITYDSNLLELVEYKLDEY